MHRAEIDKLIGKTKEGGLTLVPLRPVLQGRQGQGRARAGQGQEVLRQAADLAERDSRREIQKAFGRYVKGRR